MKRGRGRCSFIGLLALPSIALAGKSLADEGLVGEDFDAAFIRLKAQHGIQFDLPGPVTTPSPEPLRLGWLEAVLSFLAPILEYLFYAAVVLIVLGLVYFIATSFLGVSRNRKMAVEDESRAVPGYRPNRTRAQVLLEDADRLAAEGRYGDAAHLLLFRSIQDIDTARPGAVRRSLTSREIGGLAVLGETARPAFAKIARIVEVGFFGGRTLGETDWREARAAYSRFAGLG